MVNTGINATSTRIWGATFLPGLASLLVALLQPHSPLRSAVLAIAGLVSMTGSTVVKLIHDKGLHVASIGAAAADVEKHLPQLQADIATVLNFAQNDFPAVKSFVSTASAKLDSLQASIPNMASVEAAVRGELSKIIGANAAVPAPAAVPGNTGTPAPQG